MGRYGALLHAGLANAYADYSDLVAEGKKEKMTVARCSSRQCAGSKDTGVVKYIWDHDGDVYICRDCRHPVRLVKVKV